MLTVNARLEDIPSDQYVDARQVGRIEKTVVKSPMDILS